MLYQRPRRDPLCWSRLWVFWYCEVFGVLLWVCWGALFCELEDLFSLFGVFFVFCTLPPCLFWAFAEMFFIPSFISFLKVSKNLEADASSFWSFIFSSASMKIKDSEQTSMDWCFTLFVVDLASLSVLSNTKW